MLQFWPTLDDLQSFESLIPQRAPITRATNTDEGVDDRRPQYTYLEPPFLSSITTKTHKLPVSLPSEKEGNMPGESLVPGYKLVETFGPDSEYETRPSVDSGGNEDGEEVEEEVEYVTLEISGIADVDPNLLTSYRLIVSFSG